MSNVPKADIGSIDFKATDPDSVINLSNLTEFNDPTGFIGRLKAFNGGTIVAPKLLSMVGVDATVDGSSTLPTSQIISFTAGILTADGSTPDLSGLQVIVGGSFTAKNGGILTLQSSLTSYYGRKFKCD